MTIFDEEPNERRNQNQPTSPGTTGGGSQTNRSANPTTQTDDSKTGTQTGINKSGQTKEPAKTGTPSRTTNK